MNIYVTKWKVLIQTMKWPNPTLLRVTLVTRTSELSESVSNKVDQSLKFHFSGYMAGMNPNILAIYPDTVLKISQDTPRGNQRIVSKRIRLKIARCTR